jgi:hypothetical protein
MFELVNIFLESIESVIISLNQTATQRYYFWDYSLLC